MKLSRFARWIRPILALAAVTAYYTMPSSAEAGSGCANTCQAWFSSGGTQGGNCNSILSGNGYRCWPTSPDLSCDWGQACSVAF